jgi:hypothetical protein
MRTLFKSAFGLFACSVLFGAPTASATTYQVPPTLANSFEITGTITTNDATLGVLSTANITDWNLTVEFSTTNIQTLTPSDSTRTVTGTALSATATQLLFNFSAPLPSNSLEFDSTTTPSFGVKWESFGDGKGEVLAFDNTASEFTTGITGNLPIATTPLPAALPLFATGLGALGLLGWRRKRKAQTIG